MVAEAVTPAGTAHYVRRNKPCSARVAAYGVPAESTAAADINDKEKELE